MKKAKKRKREIVHIETLTEEQFQNIDFILQRQCIVLDDDKFYRFIHRIEDELQAYSRYLKQENDEILKQQNARRNVIKKIEDLKHALTTLPASANSILNAAIGFTKTQAALERATRELMTDTPKFNELMAIHAEDDLFQVGGLPYFVLTALIEACEIALSPNPPLYPSPHTEENIVDRFVNKGGRPKNTTEQDLVLTLAIMFKNATGIEPTSYEEGAFSEFLTACLTIVEPKRDEKLNRDLIENSLPLYLNSKKGKTLQK